MREKEEGGTLNSSLVCLGKLGDALSFGSRLLNAVIGLDWQIGFTSEDLRERGVQCSVGAKCVRLLINLKRAWGRRAPDHGLGTSIPSGLEGVSSKVSFL